MSPLQVSIIVCTFNRANLLRGALNSLCAMTTDSVDRWEILVVDNGSTDDTAAICAEYLEVKHPTMRYVFEPHPGISAARNRGVAEAQGEWIAFFDDDQLATPSWIEELFCFAKTHVPCCAAGEVRLKFEVSLPPRHDISMSFAKLLGASGDISQVQKLTGRRLPGTGNVIVHRRIFERVGAFDEVLAEGGEDNDFFRRARQAGFTCWLIPNAAVEHRITPDKLQQNELRSAARRMGWYLGRIQARDEGAFKTVLSLALRTLRHLGFTIPMRVIERLAAGRRAPWPFSPRPRTKGSWSLWPFSPRPRFGGRGGGGEGTEETSSLPTSSLCEIWRFQGYWRSVLHHLFPSLFAGETFRKQHDFRQAHANSP